ncbi:MAG TPA: flagellar export chaperone FliS [Gammaproteobacteria bacterium]|nr:flagellar export chaperone FliS [Gammaproteobacteria bacterium]
MESASPHRLIQMLLEGALDKIAAARGHMERGEIQPKGEQVGSAISIIEGLKSSLDKDRGGEIARNLEDLYIYMERRLIEANRDNDTSLLDEVSDLLRQIKEAWDAIADQAAQHATGA